MADYSDIKLEILDELPTNNQQEITAARLRGVLDDMLDVINETKEDTGSHSAVLGFKYIASVADLPDNPTAEEKLLGYVLGTHLIVYVGTDGDVKQGKYKDVGEFRGPQGVQGEPGQDGQDGAEGPQGPQGPQGETGAKGEKGDQGNTGSSVEYPYELVNNLTTNDATKGLSAAQGVVIKEKIDDVIKATEEDGFHIVDSALNTAFRVDEDGIDFAKIKDHAVQVLSDAGIGSLTEVWQDGFYIVDSALNIGFNINENVLDASDVNNHFIELLESKGISGGGFSGNSFPAPKQIINIKFATSELIPTEKGTLCHGEVQIELGVGRIKKYATIEVQGASSQYYDKKNFTFALFNDPDYSEEYECRINNMVPHSEYVYKANWIDASHSRNIVANRIWEQFVLSRDGYPKRETEVSYDDTDESITHRINTGALGHVDGFPCVLYINDSFYGIGCFNIGKKRGNYNMGKNTQTHILMSAEDHNNFYSYTAAEWEIRNPKTPDEQFETRIANWFNSNSLTGDNFKTQFPVYHYLDNAIDYWLFVEFLSAPDCSDKNFLLASWDGIKYAFMPYDLDTIFGLDWDGKHIYTNYNNRVGITSSSAVQFWTKFNSAYHNEITTRYLELRKNVLTSQNIYKLLTEFNSMYGEELFEKEYEKWPDIPSNSLCYTGIPQIMDWIEHRLIYMDNTYGSNN